MAASRVGAHASGDGGVAGEGDSSHLVGIRRGMKEYCF